MSRLRPANASRSRRHRRHILLAMDLTAETYERRLGIADYAREAGWIVESRLSAFLQRGQQRDYLASIRVDGVISRLRRSTPALYRIVRTLRVPVVDLFVEWPRARIPRVLPDYVAHGRLAAEHLLDRGFERIWFYGHALDENAARLRCAGCVAAARERGVTVRELWWDPIEARRRRPRGRVAWLAAQLRRAAMPLGVVAGNDFVAAEVLDAAEQAGLRVPEDVAIASIDNDPMLAEVGRVPLTSVDIARQRTGYEAAALLDRLLDGAAPPAGPLLIAPAGVVVRRSTEVTAVADPDVAAAARFIRDHFREPISVADVAAGSFLSRRRLQDRFESSLGHGMADEIERQRLEFARHLLAQTRHKVASVATMSGFGGVHRMDRAFRRILGTTPLAYRLTYRPVAAR